MRFEPFSKPLDVHQTRVSIEIVGHNDSVVSEGEGIQAGEGGGHTYESICLSCLSCLSCLCIQYI